MSYAIVRILAVMIFMSIPIRIAMATRLPTDIELHACYCIPVVIFDATLYRHAIQLIEERSKENPDRILKDPVLAKKTREVLTEMQGNLNNSQLDLRRLQLYIAPRIEELDPVSLLIANKRAVEDLDSVRRIMPECNERCFKNPDSSTCLNACAKQIIPGVRQRFESCRNLSWLPF